MCQNDEMTHNIQTPHMPQAQTTIVNILTVHKVVAKDTGNALVSRGQKLPVCSKGVTETIVVIVQATKCIADSVI